jgi:hypothetical protein
MKLSRRQRDPATKRGHTQKLHFLVKSQWWSYVAKLTHVLDVLHRLDLVRETQYLGGRLCFSNQCETYPSVPIRRKLPLPPEGEYVSRTYMVTEWKPAFEILCISSHNEKKENAQYVRQLVVPCISFSIPWSTSGLIKNAWSQWDVRTTHFIFCNKLFTVCTNPFTVYINRLKDCIHLYTPVFLSIQQALISFQFILVCG